MRRGLVPAEEVSCPATTFAATGTLRTALALPRTLPAPAVPSLPGSPPVVASGCCCGSLPDVAACRLPADGCKDALFELTAPDRYGLTKMDTLARNLVRVAHRPPPTCLRALSQRRMLTGACLYAAGSPARTAERLSSPHGERPHSVAFVLVLPGFKSRCGWR